MAQDRHFDKAMSNPLDGFRLVAETKRQVEEVSQRAMDMIKHCYKTPDDLVQCIEVSGTPVYVVSNWGLVRWAMFFMGITPGFIPPSHDKRYQYLLNLMENHSESKNHCHQRHGVFIVTQSLYNVRYLAHQVYHWLSYTSGLPGYKDEERALYQKFWDHHQGVMTFAQAEQMSAAEITQLRNAIHRDLEALQFLKQLIMEVLQPAQKASKVANGLASA